MAIFTANLSELAAKQHKFYQEVIIIIVVNNILL